LRITADTNVLVRASVLDDPNQAKIATEILRSAEIVATPLAALCEYAWVLRQGYRRSRQEIADCIRKLLASPTVRAERLAVDAGLAALDAGGDFADGVIAFTGHRLGGTAFASFDRKAVAVVAAAGGDTHLLDSPPA
jgi:predicted nucleic-acid-binding protein